MEKYFKILLNILKAVGVVLILKPLEYLGCIILIIVVFMWAFTGFGVWFIIGMFLEDNGEPLLIGILGTLYLIVDVILVGVFIHKEYLKFSGVK